MGISNEGKTEFLPPVDRVIARRDNLLPSSGGPQQTVNDGSRPRLRYTDEYAFRFGKEYRGHRP